MEGKKIVLEHGERYGQLTVLRKLPNGNYKPGNCRWATKSEQAFNRRPKGSAQ